MAILNRFFSIFLLSFLLLPIFTFAQQDSTSNDGKKEVEILNADNLKLSEVNGVKTTELIGNVQLRQEQLILFCDRAVLDKNTNSFDAFGNVKFQNQEVDGFSNFLKYWGDKKLLMLQGKVILTDQKMQLHAEEVFYNNINKIAFYYTGGVVYREKSIIRSQQGYYYTKNGNIYFNKNVDIKDPEYHLTSDTLLYNVDNDITVFFGNTIIDNKSSQIYCDNGWFDTKRNIASFGKNTKIVDGNNILISDSLYYERATGFGKLLDNFHWKDTTMKVDIFGEKAEYKEEKAFVKVWQKAWMIYDLENDSLYLTADTLISTNRSKTDSTKDFYAYHNARLYTDNMQAKCDSLFYSFSDSVFRFHQSPILWNDSTQMTGISIFIAMKNKKIDQLTINENAFIIYPSGKQLNDQVKGKNIYGFFKENQLAFVNVLQNAESLYFGKEDNGKYLGANKTLSTNMNIYFKDKKMDRITFIEKPEAVFTPMKKLTKEAYTMEGFNWLWNKRPVYPTFFFDKYIK